MTSDNYIFTEVECDPRFPMCVCKTLPALKLRRLMQFEEEWECHLEWKFGRSISKSIVEELEQIFMIRSIGNLSGMRPRM